MIKSCVIIGTGHVAYHIANALKQTRKVQIQIFGRNSENAKSIAQTLEISYATKENEIYPDADIYLLCVSDSAIGQVASIPELRNNFLVHMAGSVDIEVLSHFTNIAGVLYPLQSFTRFRHLDYNEIPFFIEATAPQYSQKLHDFASYISSNISELNSKERLWLHLAAVIASNFSNHMYSIAHQILKEQNIKFELLKPIITETAQKALELAPSIAQTGPAIRNNLNVMEKHLEMLEKHPDWQKIYTFVSNSIYQLSKEKNEL